MNDINNTNLSMTTDEQLINAAIRPLELGLNELNNIRTQLDRDPNIVEHFASDTSFTSFAESFPYYPGANISESGPALECLKSVDPEKLLNRVELVVEHINSSEILQKLVQSEGLYGMLNKFNQKFDNTSVSNEELFSALNKVLEPYINSNIDLSADKPLGALGEITLNQIISQGKKVIGPLSEHLENIGLDYNQIGYLITFTLLYRGICNTYAYSKSFSPGHANYGSIKGALKNKMDIRWIRDQRRFSIVWAPGIALAALFAKEIFLSRPQFKSPVNIESLNPGNFKEVPKDLGLFALFTRASTFVGTIVLILSIINFSRYILNKYSIDLTEPYYINIFIFVWGSLALASIIDYLFRYFIIIYFDYKQKFTGNKIVISDIISDRYPKFIYDYFEVLLTMLEINYPYKKYILFNIFGYVLFFLLLFFIYYANNYI